MKKLFITILTIIPAYLMSGQTIQELVTPPTVIMGSAADTSSVDPYYEDPEDIWLERSLNGMAGPRSISLEDVSASYTDNYLIINVEYYSGPLYIEIKKQGASVFYDIRNITFNGVIIIPIDDLSVGVYQLVIRAGSTYSGYFIL